jgi:hypothetical protein
MSHFGSCYSHDPLVRVMRMFLVWTLNLEARLIVLTKSSKDNRRLPNWQTSLKCP